MDPINSSTMASPEIFAMKKAIEVQGEGVMKVLESAQAPSESSTSGSSLTGIGQTLDLRA
ncbi:MAG TPA: hypothetical protein VFX66_04750 [Sulfuricurvum sp.]|nr:hypothetical protein [Sulfuricurvum sp.]